MLVERRPLLGANMAETFSPPPRPPGEAPRVTPEKEPSEPGPEPEPAQPPATATPRIKHWSGVQLGATFEATVKGVGPRKDQEIVVRLRRDATTGCSVSLEPTMPWTPAAGRADCEQQLRQRVQGKPGVELVRVWHVGLRVLLSL